MALTKAAEAITDWTAVAQNATGESGTLDISGHYETTLHIQAFLDTETAHIGTRFKVQVSSAAAGDEDWQDWTEFIELVGTANQEPITDNPLAAGSTTIHVASTTGYATGSADNLAGWRGIKNGTLANSELVWQVGYASNEHVIIQDGTTNQHAQNTNMYNIAFVKSVGIGMAAGLRARLLVDNTVDINGSTLNFKVSATKVTAL